MGSEEDIRFEDFTLAGVKGIKTSLRALPPLAGGCEMYYFPKNSRVYSIGFCFYEAFFAPYSSEKIVKEKILSSFKF